MALNASLRVTLRLWASVSLATICTPHSTMHSQTQRCIHRYNDAFMDPTVRLQTQGCVHGDNSAFTNTMMHSRTQRCIHGPNSAFTDTMMCSQTQRCIHRPNGAFTDTTMHSQTRSNTMRSINGQNGCHGNDDDDDL